MAVGGEGDYNYTHRYTVTRMTSALRWAAMRAICFIIVRDNVNDSVHRPQLLKQIRTEVPLLTSLTPYR